MRQNPSKLIPQNPNRPNSDAIRRSQSGGGLFSDRSPRRQTHPPIPELRHILALPLARASFPVGLSAGKLTHLSSAAVGSSLCASILTARHSLYPRRRSPSPSALILTLHLSARSHPSPPSKPLTPSNGQQAGRVCFPTIPPAVELVPLCRSSGHFLAS